MANEQSLQWYNRRVKDFNLSKRERVHATDMKRRLEVQPKDYPLEKYAKMPLYKVKMMF